MSARVMRTLAGFTPRLEVYSIDEAFLDLSGNERRGVTTYGREIAATVRRVTGIPVSVGIGPTKVLAKVANRIAKRNPETGGVLDFTALGPHREAHLSQIDVKDVWGIGRRWSERLTHLGISTALDLRDADPRLIRRRLSVVGERIVHELRGVSCLDLEEAPPAKQQILTSRTFGERVTDAGDMREAIGTFAARAAEKLRAQDGRGAGGLRVRRHQPLQRAGAPLPQRRHPPSARRQLRFRRDHRRRPGRPVRDLEARLSLHEGWSHAAGPGARRPRAGHPLRRPPVTSGPPASPASARAA